jgi:hypothetical protein
MSKPLEQKQEEASARQEIRDARNPQQQIDHLDIMFGKGKGAKRERGRLQLALEQTS